MIFVFDPAYETTIPQATPDDDEAAIAFARDQLHARVVLDADGITMLSWDPPPGTKHIALPGATPLRKSGLSGH